MLIERMLDSIKPARFSINFTSSSLAENNEYTENIAVFHKISYIQRMMKIDESVKSLENKAEDAVLALLSNIPVIVTSNLKKEYSQGDNRHDFLIDLECTTGSHRTLFCEVKSSGQPRHIRSAVLSLRDWVDKTNQNAIPLIITPYLSEEARAICRDYRVGYLDFEGNCRLAFDGVYIERQVPSKPAVERRDLKSLFSPKAEQVLRVLFRQPNRHWLIQDLAHEAKISVGHVSNVRNALISKEWAEKSAEGMSLIKPNELLKAWQQTYSSPKSQRLCFYTPLHGNSFDSGVSELFSNLSELKNQALLASFSAARWQAPFTKSGNQFLYAKETVLDLLISKLKLSSAAKGENVLIFIPKDEGVFMDADNPAPNIYCTSTIQTYLDLSIAGERGQEAAEHLRQEKLTWI